MEQKEYVRVKYADSPPGFRAEYKIDAFAHKGWVYFKVVHGAYGLPQSGKLANDLLRK